MGVSMISQPQPLKQEHLSRLESFSCGVPALDHWLKTRAYANQINGSSRTYLTFDGTHLVGFYCISVYSIQHNLLNATLRRNMPDPIPVILLGRLAVDVRYQGKGLGTMLVSHALAMTKKIADIGGVVGLAVHPFSENEIEFYKGIGFKLAKSENHNLMIYRLKTPN